MRGRLFLVPTFLVAGLLAGCESTQPGSLELVFHWPEGATDEVDRLFFGMPNQQTLNFAVAPTCPNGCGPEYGAIATDYVGVTVSYRLPESYPAE